MKRIIPAAASAILFAAVCFGFYMTRDIAVYGQSFSADRTEIKLEGDKIDSASGVADALKKFPNLKSADLGEHTFSIPEAKLIRDELPSADIKLRTYVEIEDKKIPTDSEIVDMSDVKIKSEEELEDILPYFTSCKSLNLGENLITSEFRQKINEEYPDIALDAICTYRLNGKTVREDTEKLDLKKYQNTSDLVGLLSLFPNLKKVDLTDADVPFDEQIKAVTERPEIDFTWAVDFGGVKFDSTSEEIDLSECEGVTADDVRRRIPLFKHLKKIDLTGCDATNEEMAKLREEFPETKVVWTLYMGKWSLKTDAVAFSVLIYDYKHKRLTSDDIEVLKYCTDLRALDLGHQAIRDVSVIGEYLTELRVLILADNAISDLSPLANLKHLHYLELFVNWIYDIRPLAELKELVDLNISYNWITNAAPLLDLPMLERLWIESTNISKEDTELLKKTYPGAKIVRDGEGSVDQGWRNHYRYYSMMDMWFNNYLSDSFSQYDR